MYGPSRDPAEITVPPEFAAEVPGLLVEKLVALVGVVGQEPLDFEPQLGIGPGQNAFAVLTSRVEQFLDLLPPLRIHALLEKYLQ